MAGKILMVDTSVLIDHFRKTMRENSRLYSLFNQYDNLVISAVTQYEVLVGANKEQSAFWESLLSEFEVLPFDSGVVQSAIEIKTSLKRKRKSIETADLFIAATAVAHDLPFETLNRKDFVGIESLNLLTDSK
jgi:predicted nucleic acid-binding protein